MKLYKNLNSLMNLAEGAFKKISHVLQPLLLLAFRLYFGWALFSAGKGKLLHHERATEFFTSLGIPAAGLNAWFVGGIECVGGLLLLLGLLSRPAALVIAGNMLVAYLSVAADRAALFGIFSDPQPFLSADPFFFLLTSLLVLALGPGLISLDRLYRNVRLPSSLESSRSLPFVRYSS